MKVIILHIILLLHAWSYVVTTSTNTEVATFRCDAHFTQLVKYDGYQTETHKVTTSDGYILSVFRVSSPNCTKFVGEPIIFMHGIFLSGDDCIIPGPRGSHCYEYTRTCRDVWVPNARGTVHSCKHVKLNPDKDLEFWNFGFDEMALYDLPGIIDYVLEKTEKKQAAFIGHSQGVALLLVLCDMQPEYNDKISVCFVLSATAWLDHSKFIVIQTDGVLSSFLTGPITAGLNAEFLPRDAFYQHYAKLLCGKTDLSYEACSAFLFFVLGNNSYQIPEDTMKVLTGHIPGGTSLKNFNRWTQIRQNGFTQYDFGAQANLLKYGNLKPPAYDLSKVSMKWIFIGSKNDYVSVEDDLDTLISKLSDAMKCIVSDKTFGHLDYLYGKDVPTLITPMFFSYLETGKCKCL